MENEHKIRPKSGKLPEPTPQQPAQKTEPLPQPVSKQEEAHAAEPNWQEDVIDLCQEIANDCSLKKGTKAKFIKHAEKAEKILEQLGTQTTPRQALLLAGVYKNLGKLGEHEESLEKAIDLLRRGNGPKGLALRWTLQLTALKSSGKNECYELAVKTQAQSRKLLQTLYVNSPPQEQSDSPSKKQQTNHSASSDEPQFVRFVLSLLTEQTPDEVIWLYNERSLAQEMLDRLRRQCNGELTLPYFAQAEFHIADIMTLESCREGWWRRADSSVQDLVTYLSISCFTIATEKYYLQDYTHKHNHLKSLKIALAAFDFTCTYVSFLIKILEQHFGKRLQPITEQKLVNGVFHELMRPLPKDKKEVSLKYLVLADE